MNARTIRIQGNGRVRCTPNRTALSLTVTATEDDFGGAVETATHGVKALQRAGEEVGIARTEMKTSYYNVSSKYDYRGNQQTHIGFEATHRVSMELPIDNALLSRFMAAVIGAGAQPQIHIAFTVSDPEKLKQDVLASAVANAQRRAETIATASGTKLGRILNIEYGYTEIRIGSEPYALEMAAAENSPGSGMPEMTPDEIDAEDTVTVTWELE